MREGWGLFERGGYRGFTVDLLLILIICLLGENSLGIKFFEAFHNFVYFVFLGTLSTNATPTNLEMESL